ncbi:hypothetical protein M513_06398 [Trichuris suis]|uniref:WW domain-containing protein n=1 Tax=Trichuris suis TaxID=68888 RepID=A0A085M696_9BILA|nr:hypothetical protein M513_06398 [Trichuris suis]
MPLPPLLLARLKKRGIVKEDDRKEEIIAESYDDGRVKRVSSDDRRQALFTGAPGCPNKPNPYHLCTDYCFERWGEGLPISLIDSNYMRRRRRMLRKYPLPDGWREAYDPGSGRFYYWNSRNVFEVCWLSPKHPRAKITVSACARAKAFFESLNEAQERDEQRKGRRQRFQDSDDEPVEASTPKHRRGRREVSDLDPMDPAAYSDVPRLSCIVLCPLVLSDCSPCDRQPPKFNFVAQRVPFRRPPFVARADATISVRETAGKPLPICPCVKQMATGQCISYDSRYLAVDLQEAIVEFPDLTMIHVRSSSENPEMDVNGMPVPLQPFSSQGPNDQQSIKPLSSIIAKSFATTLKPVSAPLPPLEGACKGLECLFCSDLLTRRLKQLGLLDEEKFVSVRQKLGLNRLADIFRVVGQLPCKRFNFAMPNKSVVNLLRRTKQRAKETNGTFANFLRTVSQAGLHSWNSHHTEGVRVRREATTTKVVGTELGTSYKLDCIRRGQSIDGTEWLGLCNVCWVWRRLPSDYFPQYVNELICDEDTKCLSGWGTCKQRQRSMEVLRNIGTADEPVWKSVTINTANFCDCFVQSGTVMHTFIAA